MLGSVFNHPGTIQFNCHSFSFLGSIFNQLHFSHSHHYYDSSKSFELTKENDLQRTSTRAASSTQTSSYKPNCPCHPSSSPTCDCVHCWLHEVSTRSLVILIWLLYFVHTECSYILYLCHAISHLYDRIPY